MGSMSGFTFNGVHSGVHGVVVTSVPTQPVLPDVKMGEYDRGLAEGALVDPVSFRAGVLQLECVCEGSGRVDLQQKLDAVKAWLNPLSGPKLLVPDWLVFAEDSTLSRGWYAVLNGPIYEFALAGRHAVRFQLNFKIPDPAQYGASIQTAFLALSESSGGGVVAAGGNLDGLPTVSITGAAGATVTVGDGTRSVVAVLPEGGSMLMDSQAQTVTGRNSENRLVGYYIGVTAGEGALFRFLRVTPGAGSTWSVSADSAVSVAVFWRSRWR